MPYWQRLQKFSSGSQYDLNAFFSQTMDFPGGSDGKAPCLQCRRPGFDPWVGKIPWRKEWQPTPVFLPGKSHGQRSLAVCCPWSRKELGMTERLTLTQHSDFIFLHIFLTVSLSLDI